MKSQIHPLFLNTILGPDFVARKVPLYRRFREHACGPSDPGVGGGGSSKTDYDSAACIFNIWSMKRTIALGTTEATVDISTSKRRRINFDAKRNVRHELRFLWKKKTPIKTLFSCLSRTLYKIILKSCRHEFPLKLQEPLAVFADCLIYIMCRLVFIIEPQILHCAALFSYS